MVFLFNQLSKLIHLLCQVCFEHSSIVCPKQSGFTSALLQCTLGKTKTEVIKTADQMKGSQETIRTQLKRIKKMNDSFSKNVSTVLLSSSVLIIQSTKLNLVCNKMLIGQTKTIVTKQGMHLQGKF